MIAWFKKQWKSCIGFLVALWPALRLFLRWPIAAVSIACIPIQQFIQDKLNLGPVTSKFIGFVVFAFLLWLSWHVAEIIVLLAALAFVMEVILLIHCIKQRLDKPRFVEAA